MEFGQRLKEIRKSQGLTQRQLAQRMGITPQMISQWESSTRIPKAETLERLANALDVPVETLAGLAEGQEITEEVLRIVRGITGQKFQNLTPEEAVAKGFLHVFPGADVDRIARCYSQLNADGRYLAARRIYQHLDRDVVAEIADYIQNLTEVPQLQNQNRNEVGE